MSNRSQGDAQIEEELPDPKLQIRLATFDRYRGLLFSVAYRMLGSVADAEDMLQETYIRWQQAGDAEIRSPRALLVTIVSRLCINHLQSARAKREEYVGEWLPEPIVTGVGSDPLEMVHIDESLSMAFLVILERLNPVERAVFLLREVFAYEYSEIAAILSQSEENCRQILSRAKQHVSGARPRFKTSQTKKRDLLERFLQATSSGDMEALVAVLAGDVVLHSDGGGKGAAAINAIRGVDRVARGALGAYQKLQPKDLEIRLTQVNGDPGIVSYLHGKPYSVLTIDASDDRIHAVYVVTNPEKLARVPPLPADSQ